MKAQEILSRCPIIPLLHIDQWEDALPLAGALVAGGATVLEVVLRTPISLRALEHIKNKLPEAWVGAGTVLTPEDLQRSIDAGADFIFTPGVTPRLLETGASCGIPFIPGIATASELMLGKEHGLDAFKFFPAEASGGVATLKSWHGPFSTPLFCPTGGVTAGNMTSYLALPHVPCVGGSWLTPKAAIATKNWAAITQLAKDAIASI